MSVTEVTALIGAITVTSGLLLGILKYRHQRDTSRPRLVIRLYDASGVVAPNNPQKKTVVFVDICNVGQVPVMMGAVIKFLPKCGQQARSLIFLPEPPCDVSLPNEVILPGELKPQHRAMLRFDFGPDDLPEGCKLGRAYVSSAVGEDFKASAREMRRFAKSRKEAATRVRKAHGCP